MYTHYWKWSKSIANKAAFSQWSDDVRTLYEHLPPHSTAAGAYYDNDPLIIGGPNNEGTGTPTFTEEYVGFNGSGYTSSEEELSSSVFDIRLTNMGKKLYDFCPTGRKPYDLLVCAALIRLKVHFPSIQIASDGDPKDWMQAVTLCQQTFGLDEGHLPFTEQEEFESPAWT